MLSTVAAMELSCDLHIHSRFSRATSKDLNLGQLYQWAQRKGIAIVGTGDFTHPGWREELRRDLVAIPGEPGFFALRPELREALDAEIPRACRADVRFVLTAETSHIYKKAGAVRKVHNLVLAPDLDVVERLCQRLVALGCNLNADGRPIFGLPCRDFFEIILETDRRACLIPAHIWTPHFSLFGSLSGFDRIEDCFADLTPHIFALETGLSSDPAMNWRLSQLDRYTLISNSDAHSAQKLGRELNLINIQPSYDHLRAALEHCRPDEFLGTVEFFPEEGKYHLDGHRACQARLEPAERLRLGGKCPVCEKDVTVGVLSRVEALADRSAEAVAAGARPSRARPFTSLVPLPEIVAEVLGVGVASDRVQRLYFKLLDQLGSDLHILRHVEAAELRRAGGELLAEAVRRVRAGALHIAPGYDGEYGQIRIFEPDERTPKRSGRDEQMGLFA